MSTNYILQTVVDGKVVNSTQFEEFELDHILFGMEDYYANLQYNELEPDTLEQWEGEVSGILGKIGAL